MTHYRLTWGLVSKVLKVISNVLIVLYPFIVCGALVYGGVRWLAWVLILIFILRLLAIGGSLRTQIVTRAQASGMLWIGCGLAVFGLGLSCASVLLKNNNLLLYYPVCVSVMLLVLFGSSLWSKMPLVERLARMQDPNLPAHAIAYTRKVTQVWCLFFVFNAVVSLITCWVGDICLWTLYNGFASYLLLGLLMIGEFFIRKRVQKKHV